MSDNSIRNNRPDYLLIFAAIALATLGVVVILSVSSFVGYSQAGDVYFFTKKHLFFLLIGVVLTIGAYLVDLNFYRRIAPWALVFSIILMLLTRIPALSVNIGGSTRWVNVFLFSFQPSEFVKLFTIIYLANAITYKKEKIREFFYGLFPLLGILGIIIFLVLISPDLGTSVVMTLTVFFMLYIGGATSWHILILMFIGGRALWWNIFNHSYQKDRLFAFLDPWKDPLGKGFSLIQSLIAIGSGGFWGVGLGQSTQKFSYLPQHFTDFVFSVLSEEMGFVGAVIVILIIMLIFYRAFLIAYRTQDMFIRLLVAGIAFMIFLQSILNIMVSAVMIPTTGMTLPLISYGGSSLITTMVMIGILANMSRRV